MPTSYKCVWLALLVAVASACRTPCQRVCVRMANYAEECGFTVPEAELEACLDEQADGEQSACRQAGDPLTIRREWSCEDLRVFFGQ